MGIKLVVGKYLLYVIQGEVDSGAEKDPRGISASVTDPRKYAISHILLSQELEIIGNTLSSSSNGFYRSTTG